MSQRYTLVVREETHLVRTTTHTHVRKWESEYPRLANSGDWVRERMLLVWLAKEGDPKTLPVHYLGSIRSWEGRVDARDFRRVVRRFDELVPPADRGPIAGELSAHVRRMRAPFAEEARPESWVPTRPRKV